MDMGRAPPHRDTLIRPAACGRCPKSDSLKDEPRPRSLSLPVLATRPPTRARTTRTVRWTLALRPAETNYLGEPKTL